MDRIAQDLEGYRAAVSALTINELVAIGRAQIAAENAWAARLDGGFANRLVGAAMTRQNVDFASLAATSSRRRTAEPPVPDPEVTPATTPADPPEVLIRAIQRRSTGSDGDLPVLDERSESVDIVIAYALKALGSALIAFQHRDALSEADFAFLVGPYAMVIGGRTVGAT
jgi:hypothetical protein